MRCFTMTTAQDKVDSADNMGDHPSVFKQPSGDIIMEDDYPRDAEWEAQRKHLRRKVSWLLAG